MTKALKSTYKSIGLCVFIAIGSASEARADPPQTPNIWPSVFKTMDEAFPESPVFKDGIRTVEHRYLKGLFRISDNGKGTLCQYGCNIDVITDEDRLCSFHTDVNLVKIRRDPSFKYDSNHEFERDFLFKSRNNTFYVIWTKDLLQLNKMHTLNYIYLCESFVNKKLQFPSPF